MITMWGGAYANYLIVMITSQCVYIHTYIYIYIYIYISIIKLYTLNIYIVACKLYFNKDRKNSE